MAAARNLLTSLLLLTAAPAGALVFDDGGVHTVTSPVTGEDGVEVRDGPGPTATEVTVSTSVERGVSATGISHAILDTATTGTSVFALNDAMLDAAHSEIGNDVYGNHETTVTVHDSLVLNNIFALGYADIEVSASTVGDPNDPGGRNIFANDAATIRVHSDTVVLDDVFTNDVAFISIEDAAIGSRLFANGMSRIDLAGGSVAEGIESNSTATVRIVGLGFQVDGTPVAFGPLAALTGQLTGELADGSPLDNAFERDATATIELVEAPEPALLLPWIACVGLLARAAGRRGRESRTAS